MLRERVGRNIKALREHHGLSQTELGNAVGASTKTIVSIEKGHAATNLDLLEAIARELGVQAHVLVSAVESTSASFADQLAALTADEAEFEDIANFIQSRTGGRISLKRADAKNKLSR